MVNGSVLKPQWKAAIDFKWIRDNQVDVALNIKNRNSNANLNLVLELYERMLNLQKVRFWYICIYLFNEPEFLAFLVL